MTTVTFYARGDSATANNASLNITNTSQLPTTTLVFDSGANGDVLLDYVAPAGAGQLNGYDPDTTVSINGGPALQFRVEQTGYLPLNNGKVPDVAEGKEVVVISVGSGGTYQRYFFLTDGSGTLTLMNSFGNGAVPLDLTDTSPDDPVEVCFCEGTSILTKSGYRNTETLKAGDMVLNDAGQEVPILWIGRSVVTRDTMSRDPNRRPVRIPANAIAENVPSSDLFVSAQHRIVLEGSWCDLLFSEERILTPAKHLVGAIAEWVDPDADVAYFHILFDDHEILVSNGAPTESFQPALRAFNGISAEMRASLSAVVEPQRLKELFMRPDAMRSLNASEALTLIGALFAKPESMSQTQGVYPLQAVNSR
ncbi:Hint domain-containing protein [Yoonia tamlensis]|uniref:Hint domain-containing protein n=1 Tax=Yoonia tamlensis TaxID=390270 RepID=A0A1I6GZF5_9RHOB|nr:Hint domain-containing protein [Yoonia tamlensis]SFR47574.1 Hint domain-containing protein [Yoonia tamlensis]